MLTDINGIMDNGLRIPNPLFILQTIYHIHSQDSNLESKYDK